LSHPTPHVTKIKVTVTFPLGPGKPYSATDTNDTTVLVVREAAMQHFGVHEDPGSRYFLTFGPHHDEIGDDRTLKSLSDEHGHGDTRTLKFTLVKELIQG
jgi:hypothetical protein